MSKENGTNSISAAPAAAADRPTLPIRLDTSDLKSSYCNVCNATSTREEIVLNFGINQNWDLGQPNLEVQLRHRIIMSPFAVKRLNDMLSNVIKQHEVRFGEFK